METPEELENRLLGVIGAADTTLLKDEYLWAPFNTDEPPRPGSVACVRDGEAWHQFVPAQDGDPEEDRFKAVCFRFAEDGPSAIGFVGWLHTQLRELGQVGAVVICGRDVRHSPRLHEISHGIMDYWACPVGPASERFLNVIRALIEKGRGVR